MAGPTLVLELRDFVQYLKVAVPRRIRARATRPPVCLLTDAELEPEAGTAGVGAVLLDKDGRVAEIFSEPVPADVLKELQDLAGSNFVISALDLIAVQSALVVWGKKIEHRR